MANTREVMGEQECLDALIAGTLTDFEDDGVAKIGDGRFAYMNSLVSVKLPSCTHWGGDAFGNCAYLEVIDIAGGGVGVNVPRTIPSAPSLKHIVLRSSQMSYAVSSWAPPAIMRGDGALYVNDSLLDQFKSSTNYKNEDVLILPVSKYPMTKFETIDDTWAQIVSASQDGTYASKYSIGDVKSMTIDDTECYFQLVAKNADTLSNDATATAPMTWMLFKKTYKRGVVHRMNPANTGESGTGTIGGWEHSELRAWLNDDVLPLLPTEVKAAIKSVKKYSNYIAPGETTVSLNQETDDKLWVPSLHEVYDWYSNKTGQETEGPSYTDVYCSIQSMLKYHPASNQTQTITYFLRTVSDAVGNWQAVGTSGKTTTSAASTLTTMFGFCI